jgi:acyl carrier protein
MSPTEVQQVIVDCLNRIPGASDNPSVQQSLAMKGRDAKISDLELDSLGVAEWCLEIENALNIDLDPGTVEQFRSLGEVVDYVATIAR